MNPEKWREVRWIFEEAIAMPAHNRISHIEEACSGDPELRDEVVSLLQSHQEAGSAFLNTPVLDFKGGVAVAASSRVGRRIGAYQIIQEIAHGGMGEVYRAVRADGEYDGQVAIKLVRLGFDTPEILERFRHERQILATLEHPNIARLFDAGTTEDGIPYLVMELIEGTPVDQYCEDKDLGVVERLQLFRQVCMAVQYAHQRLVIHRDIKPSNILVTADSVPKLLDFGIAKIFDPAAGSEATLLRPMTPEYASPEQVRGDPITTATDVYSLGVVLYKLLTGRTPYPEKTRTPLEFAKAICEIEPARPSTAPAARKLSEPLLQIQRTRDRVSSTKLRRKLKGDLDNIVLKSLRKEPERRYASVEQLAEDIRRHLDGLPVTATPDSTSYRVSKFVRRHLAGVAATALIATAVAGGVATTLWQARVAVRERARAERRFNDVRKLANSFLFEFDEAIKSLPGSTPARSLVVKRALEYLDGLAAEARGDRSLQMEIASAYQKVAEVQGDPMVPNLGDSKGALESSRKALTILESLSKVEPQNRQFRLAVAATHQEISDVLAFSGDTAGAVQHSGEALNTYEALAANLAGDPKFQTQRVVQTYQYANLLKLTGNLDKATSEYRQALDLSQEIIRARPSDPEGKIHLAAASDGLGNLLQEKGDTAAALENRRRGLVLREELTTSDPNNANYRRELAFSHHNVGLSLVEAGEMGAALTNFRQELTLFESLSAADPKDAQGRRNRSLAHKQIGDVLMHTARIHQALVQYRAALVLDRELVSMDPSNSQALLDLSFSESKVGSALGKLGQLRPALVLLRVAIAKQEALMASDPHHILLFNHLANSYSRLADCLLDNGDRKAAVEYYRKAVNARRALMERSPNSVTNIVALAEGYSNLAQALGPTDGADALMQSDNAIQQLERLTAADRSNARYRIALAEALSGTARLYARMASAEPSNRLQRWTKAKLFYERSQQLWLELKNAGKLPPTQRQAIPAVEKDLAQCNDSLAKLQELH